MTTELELLLFITISVILMTMYFKSQNTLKPTAKFMKFKDSSLKKTTPKNISESEFKEAFVIKNELRKQLPSSSTPFLTNNLIYSQSFFELIKHGCKSKLDGNKHVIKISKATDGRWFYGTRFGFNPVKDRSYLPLRKMPYLQNLLLRLELNDPLLRIQGGRIFISQDGHYRKNL